MKQTEVRKKTDSVCHSTVAFLLSLLVVYTRSSQGFAWEKVRPTGSSLPVMLIDTF